MTEQRFDQLLDVLERCMTACEICASELLDSTNARDYQRCIELSRDLADICGSTARFVARGSEFKDRYLSLCATACKECKDECRKVSVATAQHCADVCHECHLACVLIAQVDL